MIDLAIKLMVGASSVTLYVSILLILSIIFKIYYETI